MKVLEHPLDAISAQARPYPAWYLKEGMTGLALFAAAYKGHNDAIHFARAEMRATCVDIDTRALAEMQPLYPDDWEFVNQDAWWFAGAAFDRGEKWDVVSVDTFTGDATDRSMQSLNLWCSLANKVVTATCVTRPRRGRIPKGWHSYMFERQSQLASWLVLTKEEHA